ncbi:MAG: peptide ABC transporter substrate-binding protein [Oscillospiraceae bacterium]
MVGLFTGCIFGGTKTIRYSLKEDIDTLDPQFTTNPSAKILLQNTFEGLFQKQPDGSISKGMVKDYTVSTDKKTYTFNLLQNFFWTDSQRTPVTAKDFEFALKRIFYKESPSPYAQNFLCIKNAQQILNGNLDASNLAVTAISDWQLQITLESPTDFLLELLATQPAMPCNATVFEKSKGKYGLGLQYIEFNGSYEVSKWQRNSFISMKRNQNYPIKNKKGAVNVTFSIGENENTATEKFNDGTTFALNYTQNFQDNVKRNSINIQEYEDIVWLLVFNQQDKNLANEHIRRALTLCLNREKIQQDSELFFGKTNGIIPPVASIYQSKNTLDNTEQDTQRAKIHLQTGLLELEMKKLSKLEVIVPEYLNLPNIAGSIQKDWKNQISTYINVQPLSWVDFGDRMKSNDFKIAIVPFKLTTDSISLFLLQIESLTNSEYSIIKNDVDLFYKATNTSQAIGYMHAAQKKLMNAAYVYPLFTEGSYFASDSTVKNVVFEPFGNSLYFKNAYQTD